MKTDSETRGIVHCSSAFVCYLFFAAVSLLGLAACTNAIRSPVLLPGSTSVRPLNSYTDPQDGRIVKIFLVHGMTHSDPNWADVFIQQFANRLGIKVPNCTDPFLRPTLDAAALTLPWVLPPAQIGIPPATLCIVTNASSNSSVTYEFFVLGWSPLTDKYKCLSPLEGDREENHPIKTYFLTQDPNGTNVCADHQPHYPERRGLVNGRIIKDVVLNDGFPDVILYLAPKVTPLFHNVVAQALCFMYAYTPPSSPPVPPSTNPSSPTITCNGVSEMHSADRFVFITHSLGSSILLDTLCELVRCVDQSLHPLAISPEDRLEMEFGMETAIRESFAYPTPFYMLANQNLLLSLIRADPKTDFGTSARPDKIFDIRQHPFLKSVRPQPSGDVAGAVSFPPLDIIAFSDPNDDLSFLLLPEQLPYSQNSAANPPTPPTPVTVKNVLVSNSPEFLWLFENPLPAHVNYYKDPKPSGLLDVIFCGMENGSVKACAARP